MSDGEIDHRSAWKLKVNRHIILLAFTVALGEGD